MKDFDYSSCFYNINCIADDGAALNKMHHIRCDAGLLEANGGGVALVFDITTPACHPAIGFDTAGVGAPGTNSKETGVGINTRVAGWTAPVIAITAPACHPAIGFNAASVSVSSTDRQELGIGINTRGAGWTAAVIGIRTPACHPAIGFDAAGV